MIKFLVFNYFSLCMCTVNLVLWEYKQQFSHQPLKLIELITNKSYRPKYLFLFYRSF